MSVQESELLTAARNLLERDDPATAGIWPRATALLTRQALEGTLDSLWRRRSPGLDQCSVRAQLLCLPFYIGGTGNLVARVCYAWVGLSRACHQHPYELPPTSSELIEWLTTVEQLVAELNPQAELFR